MGKTTKILVAIFFIFSLNNSYATFFKTSTKLENVVTKNLEYEKQAELFIDKLIVENEIWFNIKKIDKTPIKLKNVFWSFVSYYEWQIPKSYKYIKLNIVWIEKNSELYKNLQKLVYVDLLPNKSFKINWNSTLSAYKLYKLAEWLFDTNLVQASQIKYLKWRKATINDLVYLKKVLNKKENSQQKIDKKIEINNLDFLKKSEENSELLIEKQKIFEDVYKIIKTQHFHKNKISDIQLLEWATKWLANGSWDKFTVYFPAIENKDFMESLNWTFEWIWSYVEMEKPWILKIISPIPNSPSEKAGLQWWDIIINVDGKKILETTSLSESISWIKWPKWTKVELTILRNWKTIIINVIRDKIIIKNIEYKKINSSTYYIKIANFWNNVSSEFKESLEKLKKETKIKKIIFDLRNNPWGYLEEVSDMLWYIIPKWEKTAVVKHLWRNKNYYSKWYKIIDFSKYKIVILQNSGSASASEIFVWTLKDYFPKATIIWEQSYWKWSVQTIKNYSDGSSFKYTIAEWFTWKSQTWINKIGIPVDIKLEFDFEKFKKDKSDNQLEKAKSIK